MRARKRRLRSRGRPLAAALLIGCGAGDAPPGADRDEVATAMDPVAEAYVRLALELAVHDVDYLAAYFGPESWRAEAEAAPRGSTEIRFAALPLVARLEALDTSGEEEPVRLRRDFLVRQLQALTARAELLDGAVLSFDDEVELLYDAVPPAFDEARTAATLDRLDELLAGDGTLGARVAAFRARVAVPAARLDTVFRAAVAEARRRTGEALALPAAETVTVEPGPASPWPVRTEYLGGGAGRVVVDTSATLTVEDVMELAATAAYPGHHAFHVVRERLIAERGWIEHAVVPVFGPQAFLAEAAGRHGAAMVFPGDDGLAFARDVLFPLAGLDPGDAVLHRAVHEALAGLRHAEAEAARRYMDGDMDAGEAVRWLGDRALVDGEAAARWIGFVDRYGAFVIAAGHGRELVRRAVEEGDAATDDDARWARLRAILALPVQPSELRRPAAVAE